PQMHLSQDGSELEVHVLWRNGTASIDVETGKEIGFVKGRPEWEGEKGAGAVCSDDGRTVATVKGGMLTIRREGRLLSTAGGLGKLLLNKDGSRLLGYDKEKKAVVLLETEKAKEIRIQPVKDDSVSFDFSPGGGVYGVVEKGATQLQLYRSSNGDSRELLEATYSFRTHPGQATIRYEIKGFHFNGVESNDDELTLTMVTSAKREPFEKEMKPSEGTVQWGVVRGYWQNVQRVYACLDQGYHFKAEGSLTEYGKREE
nr:hypothetical protein [Candidatus Peribacteraceae bacterium]